MIIQYQKIKFPKKIYIDRSDTNKNLRFIVNENQIKEYLESKIFKVYV